MAVIDEVRVSIGSKTIEEGQIITATLQAYAGGKCVSPATFTVFSNSNPSAVDVEINQRAVAFNAINAGAATIIFASAGIQSVPITITVHAAGLYSITLSPPASVPMAGDHFTLAYVTKNKFGNILTGVSLVGESTSSRITFGTIASGVAAIDIAGTTAITGAQLRLASLDGLVESNYVTFNVTAIPIIPDPPPPPLHHFDPEHFLPSHFNPTHFT